MLNHAVIYPIHFQPAESFTSETGRHRVYLFPWPVSCG